jgi:hypothetical protein
VVYNASVGREASRNVHMAQKVSGAQGPSGVSQLRKAMAHGARLQAKGARPRQGFAHPPRTE